MMLQIQVLPCELSCAARVPISSSGSLSCEVLPRPSLGCCRKIPSGNRGPQMRPPCVLADFPYPDRRQDVLKGHARDTAVDYSPASAPRHTTRVRRLVRGRGSSLLGCKLHAVVQFRVVFRRRRLDGTNDVLSRKQGGRIRIRWQCYADASSVAHYDPVTRQKSRLDGAWSPIVMRLDIGANQK